MAHAGGAAHAVAAAAGEYDRLEELTAREPVTSREKILSVAGPDFHGKCELRGVCTGTLFTFSGRGVVGGVTDRGVPVPQRCTVEGDPYTKVAQGGSNLGQGDFGLCVRRLSSDARLPLDR